MYLPRKYYYMFLATVALWAGFFACLLTYASLPGFPTGLTVAGWNIEGLTYAQFQEQLEKRISELQSFRVKLSDPGNRAAPAELTLGQLGLQTDRHSITGPLQKLRTGSLFQRARQRWKLRHAEIALRFTFNRDILEQTLRATWKPLYDQQPVNARRIITPGDQVQIIPEQDAYRVDGEQLAARLLPLVTGPVWTEGSKKQPAEIELPLLAQPPSVTAESLRAQGVERKIAEFVTSYPVNQPGRIHNIRSTAQAIDNLLLKPGEIFDYAQVIQETEAKYGYREAPVIVNGKLVPGIGGGICQVSSTLYNAVLRAGLEIVERRNHSLPVSYVPLGQDATFASGHINFKFRNNTGSHLLIRTQTEGQQIAVKLFGNAPGNVTYEIESKVVKTLPAPVKYVKNPALPAGTKRILLRGKPGYEVETYRYTKKDGVVVAKTRISYDTYSPQPTLIAVHSGKGAPPEENVPPSPPIVEDGVKGPVFPQ